jgi:cytochrome c5
MKRVAKRVFAASLLAIWAGAGCTSAAAAAERPFKPALQVYQDTCAACHETGASGAPRRGDTDAWLPRLRLGDEALLAATLRGKGAMPAQQGGWLDDLEVAWAMAYLVNGSGGSTVPAPIPPGRTTARPRLDYPNSAGAAATPVSPGGVAPGSPVVASKAWEAMAYDERLAYGGALYASHCQMCHQADGSGYGPVPALAGMRFLRFRDSVIDVVLEGAGRGTMPSWRHLADAQIAAVVTFIRGNFIQVPDEMIPLEDVKARRAQPRR